MYNRKLVDLLTRFLDLNDTIAKMYKHCHLLIMSCIAFVYTKSGKWEQLMYIFNAMNIVQYYTFITHFEDHAITTILYCIHA